MFAQGYKALTENLFGEILKRLDSIVGYGNYTYNKGQVKIHIPETKGTIYGLTYENIDSCRGYTEIHSLILDEGCLAPPDILTVAVPCMRGLGEDVKTQIYITSTPKAASYLNTLIMEKLQKEPDDIELIKARTIDNAFISSDEYELMLSSLSNETVIRQELEGEILNLTAENSILSGVDCRIGQETMPSEGLVYIGIDGSGYGRDCTVVTFRINDAYMQLSYPQISGFELRNKIKAVLKTHPKWIVKRILIDQAYGQTYYENLYQEFEECDIVNFASKPDDDTQYVNIRAEGYFELVNAIRQGFKVDEEIHKELQATLFEFNQQGKLKLIPKEEIKEVIGRSPDKSDSLMLTFAYTTYQHYKKEIEEVSQTQIYLGSPDD